MHFIVYIGFNSVSRFYTVRWLTLTNDVSTLLCNFFLQMPKLDLL